MREDPTQYTFGQMSCGSFYAVKKASSTLRTLTKIRANDVLRDHSVSRYMLEQEGGLVQAMMAQYALRSPAAMTEHLRDKSNYDRALELLCAKVLPAYLYHDLRRELTPDEIAGKAIPPIEQVDTGFKMNVLLAVTTLLPSPIVSRLDWLFPLAKIDKFIDYLTLGDAVTPSIPANLRNDASQVYAWMWLFGNTFETLCTAQPVIMQERYAPHFWSQQPGYAKHFAEEQQIDSEFRLHQSPDNLWRLEQFFRPIAAPNQKN